MRTAGARRKASATLIAIGLLAAMSGCGDSHDTAPLPATAATPTTGPTPTATPLPDISGEENLFGSTAAGGGALTIEAVPQVPVYFSACLGGSGAGCTGGTIIYIGSDPGFEEAEEDEAEVPLFALPAGVPVSLEVIAIDPAVTLRFDDGGTLSAVGQSLDLGTTTGIHADLEWQLALPADAPFDAGHPVTLKLTTTASGYTDSAEFTTIIRPSTGSPPAETD